MANDDCPETASETCFQKKKSVYAYFKVKKFQKKFSKFPMHPSIHIPNGKKNFIKI